MTKNTLRIHEGDEWFVLSLQEITYTCNVRPEIIIEIIDEGIVSVHKNETNEWQFDGEALKRIRMVLRLQHDLGVNLAGAALALELLDKINYLHQQLAIKK